MRTVRYLLVVSLLAALSALALAPAATAQGGYDDWNSELPGFPTNTVESPRANCAGGAEACIERTIGEMWRRFHTEVPSCDHNNVFSLTYLRVTEDIRTAVGEGFYPDVPWLEQQDAMFARTYFLAYDNWREGRRELVPESWRIAFDAGRDQSVQGLGNLLLSMNAHVNRDFPFILYHVGLENPDGSTKKPEHDSYNARLRALYKPMLTELAARFDASIDDYDIPGTTVDDDGFFSLLTLWREAAWQNAQRLAAAETDAERREVGRSIEQYANGWAASIRAGAGYLPGQDANARNALCAEAGGQDPGYDRGTEVARPGRRAKLDGSELVAKLRCPNGLGPCIGVLRSRARSRTLGRTRYEIEPGEDARVRTQLERARSSLRGKGRVRLVARSKLGPGVAVTKRRTARVAG